ncbi:MAG: IS701 family transposase [Frankiaceae bacterium]
MWAAELSRACVRIEPLFARWEVHQRAVDYVTGLLSCPGRKNSWWLAEQAGHVSPDGIQWLLRGAVWSADALRDEVQAYVGERFADRQAVLVIGEAAFVKRGRKSVGVARQVDPATGRVENCQLALFAGYAGMHGCALVDRELYLPAREWADDEERRADAGVPSSVAFASRAELAARMVGRTIGSGLPVRWVVAGQLGTDCRTLRERCAALGLPCAFEIAPDQPLSVGAGRVSSARSLAARLPDLAFEPATTGAAEDGIWALLRLGPAAAAGEGERLLLVGRRTGGAADAAYYFATAPEGTTLGELLRVVAARSALVDSLDAARRETGLDDYEVRKWHPWYRHVSLSMLAFACMRAVRAGGATVDDLDPVQSEHDVTATSIPVVATCPSSGG